MSVDPYNVPFPPPTNFQISSSAGSHSIPISLYNIGTYITPKVSVFHGRSNLPDKRPTPLNAAGIPGTNYIAGEQLQPTFFQGEDIVFDAFLYNHHESIDLERFTIHSIVKPTQYMDTNYWTGELGTGIYKDATLMDHFIIFIPGMSSCAYNDQEHFQPTILVAGNMQLDIWLTEKVNAQQTIKPRTILVGTELFNVEYAAFSPKPDTTEVGYQSNRTTLVHSYPSAWEQTGGGLGTFLDNSDILPPNF